MINKLGLLGAALAGALLWSAPAAAQLLGEPPAPLVDMLTGVTRDNLTKAKLDDGSFVPAETPEERAKPIVPRALEVQTIGRGMLDAHLEKCGLDWQAPSFLRYMRTIRASGRYNGKQIAYIAFLHGFTQGMTGEYLKEHPPVCGDIGNELRRRVTADPIATP